MKLEDALCNLVNKTSDLSQYILRDGLSVDRRMLIKDLSLLEDTISQVKTSVYDELDFIDRLNRPVVIDDLIYRSKTNTIEHVIDTFSVVESDGFLARAIKTIGHARMDDRLLYSSHTVYAGSDDITKVIISPEISNTLIILEHDYKLFKVNMDTGNLELKELIVYPQ